MIKDPAKKPGEDYLVVDVRDDDYAGCVEPFTTYLHALIWIIAETFREGETFHRGTFIFTSTTSSSRLMRRS